MKDRYIDQKLPEEGASESFSEPFEGFRITPTDPLVSSPTGGSSDPPDPPYRTPMSAGQLEVSERQLEPFSTLQRWAR